MHYNQEELDRILSFNDRITDVISDFISLKKKSEFRYIGKCPGCGNETGLDVNTAKGVFKCFKCGNVSGNSAISYLMSRGMNYGEALDYMNQKYTFISHDDKPKKVSKPAVKIKKSDSFCVRMLAESGLTKEDVRATLKIKDEAKTNIYAEVFKSGTFSKNFGPDLTGSDIIIEYYDLEGLPVMYDEKDQKGKLTGKRKEFFRVRYQYPEEHKDRDGKPMKYQSPPR